MTPRSNNYARSWTRLLPFSRFTWCDSLETRQGSHTICSTIILRCFWDLPAGSGNSTSSTAVCGHDKLFVLYVSASLHAAGRSSHTKIEASSPILPSTFLACRGRGRSLVVRFASSRHWTTGVPEWAPRVCSTTSPGPHPTKVEAKQSPHHSLGIERNPR